MCVIHQREQSCFPRGLTLHLVSLASVSRQGTQGCRTPDRTWRGKRARRSRVGCAHQRGCCLVVTWPGWSIKTLISGTFSREFSHLSLLLLCLLFPPSVTSVCSECNERVLFCRCFGNPTLTSKLSKRSMRRQGIFTADCCSGRST